MDYNTPDGGQPKDNNEMYNYAPQGDNLDAQNQAQFQPPQPQYTAQYQEQNAGSPISPENQQANRSLSFTMSTYKVSADIIPNEHGIGIQIVDNFNKDETLQKYTLYLIRGVDAQGPIEVARRYSDFLKIRNLLSLRWPGCFIPPLPGKNLLGKLETPFIRERRAALNIFIKKVAEIPFLHNSKEYQTFLRYNGTELGRELKVYEGVNYEEMIGRFAANFQHLSQVQSPEEASLLIARFKSFLLKMSMKFRTFKAIIKEVARAKKAFYQGMAAFQTQVASEYERDVIKEYQNDESPNPVFYEQNAEQLEDKAKKMKLSVMNESLEHFEQWINTENREITALMEAIHQKERLENIRTKTTEKMRSLNKDKDKVESGQFVWKTIFSGKDKFGNIQDFQQQIAICQRDIQQLTMLIDMVMLVLAYDEINKFKGNKSEMFYKLITTASQNEIDNLQNMSEYWNIIKENNEKHNQFLSGI